MADLTHFDPDSAGNPNNGIFGLPFTEEDAKLVILPVPWEVTVSYKAGTARATEKICRASLQVDLTDDDYASGWKKEFFYGRSTRMYLPKAITCVKRPNST